MSLLYDLRHAARTLWRSPGFVLAAALTLALGIGATTTLVSALDTLLYRPPVSVREPGTIVRTFFQSANPQFGEWTNSSTSYPDFLDLARARTLQDVAALYATSVSMGRGSEARPVGLVAVSGNYFQLLGTEPLLGRLIQAEDDRSDAGTLALVLSEHLWRTSFGSDPAVVGRTLPIDNSVYTVVGVAPRGFDGGDYERSDGWVALTPLGGRAMGTEFRTARGW